MANAKIVPATNALAMTLGSDMTFKVVPKNPDGTIFDCTGYDTSAVLTLAVGAPLGGGAANEATVATSSPTYDATGAQFSVAGSAIASAINTLGGSNLTGFLKGVDGSANTAILWAGSFAVISNPALAASYL